MKFSHFLVIISFLCIFSACQDKSKLITIDDNNAPPYSEVPTIVIENYVNRLYIDLIGREPTDAEMAKQVAFLREGELKKEVRYQLVEKLQKNTEFVEGDSSYQQAYYLRLYELFKVRLIEGASDEYISEQISTIHFGYVVDSLNENLQGMEEKALLMNHLKAILDSKKQYQKGEIDIAEVYARLLNNSIYDEINMNTFNFIRASFNDVLGRFPTDAEFNAVYNVIEFGTTGTLFGQSCANKTEYIQVLTQSREFYEGLVWWAYRTWLVREPSSAEVLDKMKDFYFDKNFQKLQAELLVTDEYAHLD